MILLFFRLIEVVSSISLKVDIFNRQCQALINTEFVINSVLIIA